MQINYPNESVRRATVGFAWNPSIENTVQAMDVPPVYAPYGTPEFWPNRVAMLRGSQNSVLNTKQSGLLAPNTAQNNTVRAAAAVSGLADAQAASTPAAAASGAGAMGPITLVAPMPSITQSPLATTPAPPVPCNGVDTFVSQNPMLAAFGVFAVFLMLGGKR